MSRVSLSRKTAGAVSAALREAEDWISHHADPEHEEGARLLLRLVTTAEEMFRAEQAPKASPKKLAARKASVAVKAAKRATKREETSALYRLAEGRAKGKCEACCVGFCGMDPAELDHARGRGRFHQAIENVWLIHRSCHRARHGGSPNREHWLGAWKRHCLRHGYSAEAFDADAKLESRALSNKAAALSRAKALTPTTNR